MIPASNPSTIRDCASMIRNCIIIGAIMMLITTILACCAIHDAEQKQDAQSTKDTCTVVLNLKQGHTYMLTVSDDADLEIEHSPNCSCLGEQQ